MISLHTKIFFWLFDYGQHFPETITFLADRLDLWVIACALIAGVFVNYIYHKDNFLRSLGLDALLVSVSVLGAWLLSLFLKHLFAFPRPSEYLGIQPIFDYGSFDTFPSGHAAFFMALAVMVYLRHRKLGCMFILLALVIGITRNMAGVHMPLDILFGWCLGGMLAYLIHHVICGMIKRSG